MNVGVIRNLSLSLVVVAAACGPKPEAKTAADETTPPRAGGTTAPTTGPKPASGPQPPKQAPGPKMVEKPKVEKNERADFDALVKSWEEAKTKGTLDAGTAKSLAGKFSSAGKHHQPVAAIAHYNAGTLYDSVGETKDAEGEYQDALKADPKFGPAINALGEQAYKRNDRAKAKEWFQKGIDAAPTKNAPAYNNLALIIYQEAKESGNPAMYKDAISKLRRALAIDAESMAAYSLLALIYYNIAEGNRSKLQLAELVCKQATDANDKYAPIYNTLGLIKLRRGDVSGALKEFDKAVGLDPKYVEAHLNIGAIGLSSRQYEKAAKSFEAVLALQPQNLDATIGLGVALRGQRKFDEAEQQYKKVQQIDSKNCAVLYNLGLLYQEYKTKEDNSNLRDAQNLYRQYAGCNKTVKAKVDDANARIKIIDDTFAAIEEAKKMEEELKKLKEQEAQQNAAAAAAAGSQTPPPAPAPAPTK